MTLEIRADDLSGEPTRELVARHLRGMFELTPAESVYALDVDKLRDPAVSFWSAWEGDQLAGIGALKRLDATGVAEQRGEIKSMRVADEFLGKGVGRAMLRHIVAAAREQGMTSLWLETGSEEGFLAAQRLYLSEGFTECGPFGDYPDSPLSTYMTLTLR